MEPSRVAVNFAISPGPMVRSDWSSEMTAEASLFRGWRLNWKWADVAPSFLISNVRVMGRDAATPNDAVCGFTTTLAPTALPTCSLPAPMAMTLAGWPASLTSWVAVLTSADLISHGCHEG